jgi:hypothetical protein
MIGENLLTNHLRASSFGVLLGIALVKYYPVTWVDTVYRVGGP